MWMVEDWKIPISRYVQSRTSKFQVMGHQSSKSPKALTSRFHAIMPFVLIPHPQKLNDVSRQVQLKMQVANDNQVVLPKDWSMLSSWGLSRRSWELASLCLAASIPWWLTSKERFWMSGFLLWCLKLWCWSFGRVGPGTQGIGRWIFGIWGILRTLWWWSLVWQIDWSRRARLHFSRLNCQNRTLGQIGRDLRIWGLRLSLPIFRWSSWRILQIIFGFWHLGPRWRPKLEILRQIL